MTTFKFHQFLTLLKIVPHCFIVVEQYGCSCEHVLSFLLCFNLGIEIGQVITLRNFQVVFKSYSAISSVYECWLFNNLHLLSSTEFSIVTWYLTAIQTSTMMTIFSWAWTSWAFAYFPWQISTQILCQAFFFKKKWFTSCFHYSTVRILHML